MHWLGCDRFPESQYKQQNKRIRDGKCIPQREPDRERQRLWERLCERERERLRERERDWERERRKRRRSWTTICQQKPTQSLLSCALWQCSVFCAFVLRSGASVIHVLLTYLFRRRQHWQQQHMTMMTSVTAPTAMIIQIQRAKSNHQSSVARKHGKTHVSLGAYNTSMLDGTSSTQVLHPGKWLAVLVCKLRFCSGTTLSVGWLKNSMCLVKLFMTTVCLSVRVCGCMYVCVSI